jgi:hypothetical protein
VTYWNKVSVFGNFPFGLSEQAYITWVINGKYFAIKIEGKGELNGNQRKETVMV